MQFSKRLDRFGEEIFAALNNRRMELEAQGMKIYNMSVGTPDFKTPEHIKKALAEAAMDDNNWKYSLRDLPELLEAVCDYYKKRFDVELTPDMVMTVYGSQEGMGHLGMALCDEGDVVLLPDPCYPVFAAGSLMAGAEPYYYPLVAEHDFLPYVKDIPEEVARKAKYMVVSLPSNPVGSIATPGLYEEIIAFAKKYDILIIHDNAYSDIIFDGAHGGSFLATEGAKVVVADMAPADETVALIEKSGGIASAFTVNVSRQEEVQAMVKYAIDTYGTLDIMVNNAGINRDGMLHKMPVENWQLVIDVDLTGAFFGTQEAIKYMRQKGYGRVINISSGSWLGNIGQANYAAAKAGVVGLTKTAARENARKGITCNAICPGFIETDMTLKLKEVNDGAAWESMMQRIPMGYAGKAADVGNMVAFLASDEASYITSEVINVGGGMIV